MTSATGEPPNLERWAREAAVDESARDRARRRHLRDAARGDATAVGAVADLVERGAPVVVTTVHGSAHAGTVVQVVADAVELVTPAARSVLIRLGSIGSIQHGAGPAPLARSAPPAAGSLTDVLSELAAERARVQIRSGAAAPVVGEVEAVGADVITLAVDHGRRALVPLEGVSEVVVPR